MAPSYAPHQAALKPWPQPFDGANGMLTPQENNVASPGRILIVDDDPVVRVLLRETLHAAGFDVDEGRQRERRGTHAGKRALEPDAA